VLTKAKVEWYMWCL